MDTGSGPFRLVAWRPGRELELAANADFHWGPAYLDGVRFQFFDQRADLLAAFQAGQLQAAILTPAELRHLTDELQWSGPLQKVDMPAVYYLAFNNEAPPLNDALVRQALHYAVDRRQLLNEWQPGSYRLAHGAVPPGLAGYEPAQKLPSYDPTQARQLLAQAGLEQGFELTIWQSSVGGLGELSQLLSEMLAEVGIDAQVKTVSQGEFYSEVAGGSQAQAYILGWYADYPDAENFLFPLFHSSNWGAGGNRAKYAAPETDLLLLEMHATADADARQKLYRQIEHTVFQDFPWLPLFHPINYHVTQPEVKNYRATPYYQAQRLWSLWLEQP